MGRDEGDATAGGGPIDARPCPPSGQTDSRPVPFTPSGPPAAQGVPPLGDGTAFELDRKAPAGTERRAPLLATRLRWLAGWAVWAGATMAAVYAVLSCSRSGRPLVSFAVPLGIACAAESLIVLGLLRAEESRLSRELRTARKGTAVLRALVERRRQRPAFFMRLFSTRLGSAAALLADGDASAAGDVLAAEPPWMRVGRLGALRAFVVADSERASGTRAGRELCIRQLERAPDTGNREADLYRAFVLVKAVLEQGDADTAFDLALRLMRSGDEDDRVYAVWLRVWFDLDSDPDDGWPAIAERHVRLATLAARSQGADDLVLKLAARLAAIARTSAQE